MPNAAASGIVFRAFSVADATTLLTWIGTPDELLQWAGTLFAFPLDKRQLIEYAHTPNEHRHLIAAVDSDSESMLAHAELTVLPEHLLGRIARVIVAPDARGSGVGSAMLKRIVTLAFDELGLHRLELVVFALNAPARRCYERAGFREEGFARDARRGSDGYWDLVYMGMLASDRMTDHRLT